MENGNESLESSSENSKCTKNSDNSGSISNSSESSKEHKDSVVEEKSSKQEGDVLEPQKLLNKQLVDLCFSKSLDLDAIMKLLGKGAEAGYEQREDGT